jgi:GNAT superfamily N-acetyltransferase
MLDIRTMTAADVPLGLRLKDQAAWNQTELDWRRVLALEPSGCFVAELDGHPVGTTTTCRFDTVGWIGMVLVDQSARGQGIGTRLMEHALAYLDRSGVRTARLDATPLGRPLYEKLGFVVEYELARWEGLAGGGPCPAEVTSASPDQLEAIYAMDRQATGTNRRRLLDRLHAERPEALRVYTSGTKLSGYGTLRLGARATLVGPVVAMDAVAGLALYEAALAGRAGQAIYLDIPRDNRPATQWAEARGLRVQRPLTRMCRGAAVADRRDQLWACFGPEKG